MGELGIDTTMFAAYTRMTLLNDYQRHILYGEPFRNEGKSNNKMTFYQFQEMMEKGEVVNENNVRKTSDFHQMLLDVLKTHTTDRKHARDMQEYVDRAFSLGLVNHDGRLINRFDSKN